MRRLAALLLLLVLLLLVPALPVPVGAQTIPDADTLMKIMDELWRGKSSHARMTMQVKTDRYERSMTMEAWSEGTEKSLITILEPKKDRGIATLKVEENIWNYLPKINRVTKLPPSMMGGSWMGSHFTNDDLVKENQFAQDFTSTLTFTGERDGRRIYEVTSLPRPDAVVVWGKIVTEIEQGTLMPVRSVYFDEEGKPAREMTFLDVREFGGRRLPARMLLRPEDKPGESTTVIYEAIDFDMDLPGDLFTLRSLRHR